MAETAGCGPAAPPGLTSAEGLWTSEGGKHFTLLLQEALGGADHAEGKRDKNTKSRSIKASYAPLRRRSIDINP